MPVIKKTDKKDLSQHLQNHGKLDSRKRNQPKNISFTGIKQKSQQTSVLHIWLDSNSLASLIRGKKTSQDRWRNGRFGRRCHDIGQGNLTWQQVAGTLNNSQQHDWYQVSAFKIVIQKFQDVFFFFFFSNVLFQYDVSMCIIIFLFRDVCSRCFRMRLMFQATRNRM